MKRLGERRLSGRECFEKLGCAADGVGGSRRGRTDGVETREGRRQSRASALTNEPKIKKEGSRQPRNRKKTFALMHVVREEGVERVAWLTGRLSKAKASSDKVAQQACQRSRVSRRT